MDRFSPEDREAFTDARIAALRAGLKLTPDQKKLWPAVEDVIRGLDRQRREQMGERDVRRQLRDDFPAAILSVAERRLRMQRRFGVSRTRRRHYTLLWMRDKSAEPTIHAQLAPA